MRGRVEQQEAHRDQQRMCLDAVGYANSHGKDEHMPVQPIHAGRNPPHSRDRTTPLLGMLSNPGAGQVSLPVGVLGLTGRHEAAVFYMASDGMVWGRHSPPGQVQLRLSLLCPGAPDLWKTGSRVGLDPLKLPLAQGRCWRKSVYLIPLLPQPKVYFHRTRLPTEFVSRVPALSLNHQLQGTPHKTEGHSFIHPLSITYLVSAKSRLWLSNEHFHFHRSEDFL